LLSAIAVAHPSAAVMAGLVPATRGGTLALRVAGTSPAMTDSVAGMTGSIE